MKPVIGIPCGSFRDRDWCPPFNGHRQTYVDAIVDAGGAPMLIPLIRDEWALRTLYDQIDGLLLAGGHDVEPRRYGEEPIAAIGMVDPLRDEIEFPLVSWATEDGKPILGICRGVQVLNVALGGTLYQDIPEQLRSELKHDLSYHHQDWSYMAHDITLTPDSRLARVLGATSIAINSLHHQSVKTVAPGLNAVGWAPDGIIEALEGANGHFIVGVQCHPEALEAQTDTRWKGMFRSFIEACGNRRSKAEG